MVMVSGVLAVLLLPLPVFCSPCPGEDWIPGSDNTSCYLVSPSPVTWFAAQEFCGTHGGYLVEINTRAEQTFLSSILSSSSYYWLGLSDLAHPGHYTWQHSWLAPSTPTGTLASLMEGHSTAYFTGVATSTSGLTSSVIRSSALAAMTYWLYVRVGRGLLQSKASVCSGLATLTHL
eukprot:TRINITY_DN10115_c0_g1_i1.p1 TRINITY_DN10115_c0_g1~~TRINITY_DN10115_c0_g1_i1.p1  ORF type:complete len:176 (+),score=41.57 TRINITY_DN10115_c0_g1_i1:81-608(+)